MYIIPRVINICKRRFRRPVSLVCLMCFILVSLFSATLAAAFAEHEHEDITRCPRTQNPVCACDKDDGIALTRVRTNAADEAQPQNQNDHNADCFICVFIHKNTNPLRQPGFIVYNEAPANGGLFASMALCSCTLDSVFPSPITLMNKITN